MSAPIIMAETASPGTPRAMVGVRPPPPGAIVGRLGGDDAIFTYLFTLFLLSVKVAVIKILLDR